MIEMVPKQCKNCILLDVCIENDCLKEKQCLSRLEPKKLDPDFVAEMRERAGI